MDIEDIDAWIAKMEKNNLKRVVIKKEGFELELEKESAFAPAPMTHMVTSAPAAAQVEAAAPVEKPGMMVTSPIVGTFYAAPSPDDPPYAKVGDMVEPESIVCIIEAMKVMNEVKAGVRGKVVEILMKNGDPVEYGTAIFRVE